MKRGIEQDTHYYGDLELGIENGSLKHLSFTQYLVNFDFYLDSRSQYWNRYLWEFKVKWTDAKVTI